MKDGPPGISLPLEPVFPPSSFSALLAARGIGPVWEVPPGAAPVELAEATTVLALRYDAGVAMVGDRQATEGYTVAHRRIQKVFPADSYSAVAISGVAGIATEMVRLLQTELEHYEKLEGSRLSLEGKANHLARMVRGQVPMAMQGLVVVPLFCGFDTQDGQGHLYSYDVVGGRYEEIEYSATGSGGREAKAFLRARYTDGMDRAAALHVGVAALTAAAEEDTATAGPDLRRRIFPTVVTVGEEGYAEAPEDEVAAIAEQVLGEAR